MENLQERINKLFKNFKEESTNLDKFLINLEKLIIIEKTLRLETFKDYKRLLHIIYYIIKLKFWKKSLSSRIRYLKRVIEVIEEESK